MGSRQGHQPPSGKASGPDDFHAGGAYEGTGSASAQPSDGFGAFPPGNPAVTSAPQPNEDQSDEKYDMYSGEERMSGRSDTEDGSDTAGDSDADNDESDTDEDHAYTRGQGSPINSEGDHI
nr:uncharacterized protein CI109_006282 [Kwoniella shandongensis]KAA5525383.1 hypothetical protein CI109_006282 [Kwoniella shandongensis]